MPSAKNSITWLPQPWLFSDSETPTMPSAPELLRLALHPLHRELAGVVQRLGEVRELDVAPGLRDRLQRPAATDVVHAAAHHHPDRAVTGAQQRPELLTGEIALERPAVRGPVQHALAVLDRGADRDELGHVRAPLVAADLEPHADDPVGAELVGLLLHPRHREVAGAVHRLREDVELAARGRARDLEADVEDRAADDEADRVEAGLGDEQELVDAQVRRVQALAVLLEALAARLGDPLE